MRNVSGLNSLSLSGQLFARLLGLERVSLGYAGGALKRENEGLSRHNKETEFLKVLQLLTGKEKNMKMVCKKIIQTVLQKACYRIPGFVTYQPRFLHKNCSQERLVLNEAAAHNRLENHQGVQDFFIFKVCYSFHMQRSFPADRELIEAKNE